MICCTKPTTVTFQTADLTEYQCSTCGRLFTVTKDGVMLWPLGTEPASMEMILEMMARDGE